MPLTREQAIEIYRLATQTELKASAIGAQFECDAATVRKIKAKQRWKEATDEFDAQAVQASDQPEETASDAVPARHVGEGDPVTRMSVYSLEVPKMHGVVSAGMDDAGNVSLMVATPEDVPQDHRGQLYFWKDAVPTPPAPPKAKRQYADGMPEKPKLPDGFVVGGVKAADSIAVLSAAQANGTVPNPVSIYDGLTRGDQPDWIITFKPDKATGVHLRRGNIAFGKQPGTFVLTEAGARKIAEYGAYLEAVEAWQVRRKEAVKLRRREINRRRYAQGDAA